MPKKFLEAGKIVGTHGIRGDLKVQSWCDTPEVLCDFDTLYLDEKTPVDSPAARFIVEKAREYSVDRPLYVLAIGAITNVASAILMDPSICEKIVVV